MATKFRTIEEIRKAVNVIIEQHQLDTQLVDQTEKLLARVTSQALKAAADFKIMDISGDGNKKKIKRTFNVDFPVVKVPNKAELTHTYGLVERLSEQYKYVLNLENELRINFSNVKKHAAVDATQGSIAKLKKALETDLKRLFASLNAVARGHAPTEYLDFVEALAKELQENKYIECDSGKTVTYAAMGKDDDGNSVPVFAGYIILINAVSDEGKIAPSLYIVVKWTVGGNVEVFVEHEFIAPSLLHGGITVENLKEATKAVADQLSIEGFSAQIGNLPVATQLRYPSSGLNTKLFQVADMLTKVTADEDKLIFTLKKEAVPKAKEIGLFLFSEVKSMLKSKRKTKVRMSTQRNTVTFTFSGLDASGGVHPSDLDFLTEKYRLNDSQVRKIANIVNGS